jgi:tocopherol O-methyltransferase
LSRTQADYAARVTSNGNPRIECMDFLNNAFGPDSFDAAYAIESTEHFEDKPRLFTEMHRIVRTGGRVAICAWLAKGDPQPWETRHLLEPICREGRLPGMASEREYRSLIEGAGFRGVEFRDLTAEVARTWPAIVARVLRRLTWDVESWRYLLGRPRNAIFGITIFRIAAAYRMGSMRYGLFSAEKGE